MKPKELLASNLQTFLLEPMKERGFKFLRSRISFKRTLGPLVQEIQFLVSAFSREDDCAFDCGFQITSPEFAKWQVEAGGMDQSDGFLYAGSEQTIPGWPRTRPSITLKKGATVVRSFKLDNTAKDAKEMMALSEAILVPTVEYLDQLASWDAIIGALVGAEGHMEGVQSIACEALLMRGQNRRAKGVLLRRIKWMEENNQRDTPQMAYHKELFDRHFG